MAATVPFGMVSLGRGIQYAGVARISCRFNLITEDYFKTLEISLLKGRTFSQLEVGSSKSAGVVIIDRLAADRFWPNGDALGKHVPLLTESGSKGGRDVGVVGVVSTIRESVFSKALEPHVYVPFGQEYQSDMNLHLKVARIRSWMPPSVEGDQWN